MPTTMVNAPKMNFLQLRNGKYGKSTKYSTQRYHHANNRKSGLEAEWVSEIGELRGLQGK